MSWVSQVAEEQASPDLKPLYRQIRESFGFLPNYFQALGRAPEVIERQIALAGILLREGAVPATVKEQMVLVVSGINSSSYCIAVHMELLRKLGVEKALGRKLATDYASAPVGAKEMALMRFAEKLTRSPSDIQKADAEAVLRAGWDEAALVETVLTVAWANFINRVGFGLGLVADY